MPQVEVRPLDPVRIGRGAVERGRLLPPCLDPGNSGGWSRAWVGVPGHVSDQGFGVDLMTLAALHLWSLWVQ